MRTRQQVAEEIDRRVDLFFNQPETNMTGRRRDNHGGRKAVMEIIVTELSNYQEEIGEECEQILIDHDHRIDPKAFPLVLMGRMK